MSTALYRKYRPDNFENIIGQSQVTDVLKNQIKEDKISHAYVFSGTRGTGKTSTAKVFAKSLNCQNYSQESGPCNHCESCKNDYVDTIEIDAASNNSVDNIRALKDNIIYRPSFGRYKVYIIDEVHMLSIGAFNALLKTLEEPPEHVIFILATTEINKIPATILSRCQKFEFKKVSIEDIKSRLKFIVENEDIPYDVQAIDYIATMSDGGLRDAISTLDQVASLGRISMENLDFVTGMTSIAKIDEYLKSVFTKDTFASLKTINEMTADNVDIKKLPSQIISRLLDIIYLQNNVKTDVKMLDSLEELLSLSKDEDISDLIVEISELESDMKYASFPDILFQSFTVKKCQNVSSNQDISALVKEISALKQRIENLEKGISSNVNELKTSDSNQDENKEEKVQGSNNKKSIEKISDEISENEKQDIDFVKSILGDVHNVLRSKSHMPVSAFLIEGNIRRYVEDTIYISYDSSHSFHKTKIEEETNKNLLKEAFAQILSKNVEICIVFDDDIIKRNVEEEDANIKKQVQDLLGDVNVEIIND
jgi:DNA polymerase III, subunit gamma and tau